MKLGARNSCMRGSEVARKVKRNKNIFLKFAALYLSYINAVISSPRFYSRVCESVLACVCLYISDPFLFSHLVNIYYYIDNVYKDNKISPH